MTRHVASIQKRSKIMTTDEKKFQTQFNANVDYKPLELYSIQDKKTGKFMPPFFCINEEDAIRQCKQIVNYAPSLINKFPQDYALYFCGCFDEYHGCISASNSMLDGFIAYLDEYKTDDTVKYDDLKKEILEQKTIVQNNSAQLEKLANQYETKMKDLAILYNKYEKASVDLPPVPQKAKVKKNSIISKLFNS